MSRAAIPDRTLTTTHKGNQPECWRRVEEGAGAWQRLLDSNVLTISASRSQAPVPCPSTVSRIRVTSGYSRTAPIVPLLDGAAPTTAATASSEKNVVIDDIDSEDWYFKDKEAWYLNPIAEF